MSYLESVLQLIASGTILYFGIAALAGVVLYLLVKFPTLWKLVTWPARIIIRPVWNFLVSTKWGTKVKTWVTGTSWWKWLEGKQYDPPAHPLSWWASRGLVVLWFVVVGLSMAYWHGHSTSDGTAVYKMRAVAFAWKDRAQQCEATAATARALAIPPAPAAVIVTAQPSTLAGKKVVTKGKKVTPWYYKSPF